jgi:hypothetical protein
MILVFQIIGYGFAAFAAYDASKFWLRRTKFSFRSAVSFASWWWAFAVLPTSIGAIIGISGSGRFYPKDQWIGVVAGSALLLVGLILASFAIGGILSLLVLAYRKAVGAFERLPDE